MRRVPEGPRSTEAPSRADICQELQYLVFYEYLCLGALRDYSVRPGYFASLCSSIIFLDEVFGYRALHVEVFMGLYCVWIAVACLCVSYFCVEICNIRSVNPVEVFEGEILVFG